MFGPIWTDITDRMAAPSAFISYLLGSNIPSVCLDAIQLQNVYNDLAPRKQLCHV